MRRKIITLNISKGILKQLDEYDREIFDGFMQSAQGKREQYSRSCIIRYAMKKFMEKLEKLDLKEGKAGKVFTINEDTETLQKIEDLQKFGLSFSRSEIYRIAIISLLFDAAEKREQNIKQAIEREKKRPVVETVADQEILKYTAADGSIKAFKIIKKL